MRVLAALATFAAATALACVIAFWGWRLFGPPAAHLPAAGPSNPAATLMAANLFGGSASPPMQPAPATAVLGNDARLLGIIAEEGQRGYALFRFPAGPKLVAQGREIVPGVTLVSIQKDSIMVRDGSGERRFELRNEAVTTRALRNPAQSPSSRAASPPRTSAVATCGPPAGFRGTVVRLNTELMGGIGADTMQWQALLAPVDGGLVVREDNGFGAMLGLKAGDRIAQANGIALGAPDDVVGAVVRPLVANQGVRLVGSRNGTTQELWLANVACAG